MRFCPSYHLACGPTGKESTCTAGDLGSIPRLGRSPGERKGYPLQYSGLENSMDCIVHGVAKSWIWLSGSQFHHLLGASPLALDMGYLFLVGSNILLLMVVQQWVPILEDGEDDHMSFYSTSLNIMGPTRDFWNKILEQLITICSRHSYTWQQVSPWGEEYNQSDFNIDHLVMSMCRVTSCIVDRGCLLWPVCSLGKTLLPSALLHFVLQGQSCLLFQVSLDFLLLHLNPL